ncbi:MAG TPA: DUF4340 domain-containing protein [Polyangia bacterium]|jgi:hypothetical protein|nr:DUF4340 domain-containing protein [Polyangia bacterium]
MQRKTLIALVASVLLGIAAFFTWRAPEKGTRTGPRPRPVAAFKATDVKQLELQTSDNRGQVVLKLEGATWKVTAPSAWSADQTTVKGAVDQLERLSFGDILTENPARFADFEVDDKKGAHVVVKDGAGKVLLDGWLGKAVAGYTMFRPAGKNEVWQAANIFKYALVRDLMSWRDHTLLDFKVDDVTKLEVEGEGQKVALERVPSPDKDKPWAAKWKVLESTVRVDPLDDSTANDLAQTLSTLRAASFDDNAKPEAVGLQPPRVKVTVTTKGTTATVLVGNTKGDDTWIQMGSGPQIYLIQKYHAERLGQTPANFRDKTLVKVPEADLVAVDVNYQGESYSLKHEGANWKLPKGEADEAKLKTLISSFEELKGAAFATGVTPDQAGLKKPTGTVTLRLRDKSSITIQVGAQKDDEYYISRVGQPDLLRIKKFSADRFLKKSSDLIKTSTASN